MLLKRGGNGLDILRYRVVARLHGGQLRLGVEKQPAQTLGLLGRAFKFLEFANQIAQDIFCFARVSTFDSLKNAISKIGQFFLRIRAVEHHMVRVGHIDGAGKALDLGALLSAEVIIQRGGDGVIGIGGFGRFQLCHSLLQRLLRAGLGVEGQNGYFLFVHGLFLLSGRRAGTQARVNQAILLEHGFQHVDVRGDIQRVVLI